MKHETKLEYKYKKCTFRTILTNEIFRKKNSSTGCFYQSSKATITRLGLFNHVNILKVEKLFRSPKRTSTLI